MPTTREVDAAKLERQRRGKRYYTADLLGPPCTDPRCHLKLPQALANQGERTHPTCSTDARRLIKRDRPYATQRHTWDDYAGGESSSERVTDRVTQG